MGGRRTVSVLFSDVVGSTELRSSLGDERADEVFGRHHQEQCQAVATHAGTVVKALGDGLMAVFDSAADAVDAAASLHAVPDPDGVGLVVRVGVSAGDARMEDGDWFGLPVVEASRLCGAAAPGRVLVSDLARQLAGSRTTHRFRAVGPLELKGLGEPVVAHEVETGDEAEQEQAAPPPAAAAGQVKVVGPFAVERGGRRIEESQFGSRKGRLLLKLLAVRRGHIVAMDDIIEVLWGDAAPAKAEANVATLVSRLRGVLGADAITGGRAGYRIAFGPDLALDVDDAERLVAEAERRGGSGQPALALIAADSALDVLARGSVLEDEPGAEWAMDLDRVVGRLSRRARVAAWRAQIDLGDHRAALAHARAVIDADALDEEAHRTVIACYHRLGEQGEALRAYENLRTILRDELGADPGPETEALFAAVLRGDDVHDERQSSTAAEVGRRPRFRRPRARAGRTARAVVTGRGAAQLLRAHHGRRWHRQDAAGGRARSPGQGDRCHGAAGALLRDRTVIVPPADHRGDPRGHDHPHARRGQARGGRPRAVDDDARARAGRHRGQRGECRRIERDRAAPNVRGRGAAAVGTGACQTALARVRRPARSGASTIELLHFALRWDPRAPLLVVATVRADDADSVHEHLAPVATTSSCQACPTTSIRLLAERAGVADRADAIASMTRGHTLVRRRGATGVGRPGARPMLRRVISRCLRRCATRSPPAFAAVGPTSRRCCAPRSWSVRPST